MNGILTMAVYAGTPSLWIIGQKTKTHGVDMLEQAFIFTTGNNQIGLQALYGAQKDCNIHFGEPTISYDVTEPGLVNLYIEASTGIKVANSLPSRGASDRMPGNNIIDINRSQTKQ